MNTHKTFVRQAILRAIASGRWQPGAPIPDENELASEFGVTVGVIRETLQALSEKSCWFAQPAPVKDIVLDKVEHRLSSVAVVEHQVVVSHIGEYVANTRERLQLGLNLSSKVYRIQRQRRQLPCRVKAKAG